MEQWGEQPRCAVPKTTLLFWDACGRRRLPCLSTTETLDLTRNTISRLVVHPANLVPILRARHGANMVTYPSASPSQPAGEKDTNIADAPLGPTKMFVTALIRTLVHVPLLPEPLFVLTYSIDGQ